MLTVKLYITSDCPGSWFEKSSDFTSKGAEALVICTLRVTGPHFLPRVLVKKRSSFLDGVIFTTDSFLTTSFLTTTSLDRCILDSGSVEESSVSAGVTEVSGSLLLLPFLVCGAMLSAFEASLFVRTWGALPLIAGGTSLSTASELRALVFPKGFAVGPELGSCLTSASVARLRRLLFLSWGISAPFFNFLAIGLCGQLQAMCLLRLAGYVNSRLQYGHAWTLWVSSSFTRVVGFFIEATDLFFWDMAFWTSWFFFLFSADNFALDVISWLKLSLFGWPILRKAFCPAAAPVVLRRQFGDCFTTCLRGMGFFLGV